MTLVQTDARGNATTTVTGKTGLPLTVTAAAGHATSYANAYPHDKPATVTDALGHTVHYAYDARGRKTAEWGTGIQPAVYTYNDADRLVSLTTWRAPSETVATDPRERTDGDTTTWSYDRATGLPVRKTHADGTCEITSYDTLNRVSAITNARGQSSTRVYGPKTGELTGVTFANADGSEASPAQSYGYNHLGQLVSVTDASGTRRIAYNAFNEVVEEMREGAWNATLAETRDACGRPAGYILQYNGAPVQTTAWAYDQAGRLQTVTLNELAKPFQYDYDTENGLLFSVSYPNPLTRQTSYEATRDLVAELTYKRPGSVNDPAKVAYAYDELGRPTERKDCFNTPEPGLTHAYAYNERGEITGESLSTGGNNIYTYDNIGNRTTSQEGAATHPTTYAANALNQYTVIQEGEPGDETAAPPFVPTYDADGNQTLVKTSTGIWQVSYNAENRPVRFENAESNTSVTCSYDSMGRRYEKKVEENGTVLSHKLYLYRGYLPIAELDATNADESTSAVLRKTYLWDPSEPVATRVLAMTCFDEAGNYVEDLYYTHDALKNTTALFGILGGRRASYTYGAYGQTLSMDGNAYADNPFRYSSEYFDEELGMISYNFRHYNPLDGRWITRDQMIETSLGNMYLYVDNKTSYLSDYLGMQCYDGYSFGASITQNQPTVYYPDTSDGLSCYEGARYYANLGEKSPITVPLETANITLEDLGIDACSYNDGEHEITSDRNINLFTMETLFAPNSGPGRINVHFKGVLTKANCKWSLHGGLSADDDKFNFDPKKFGDRKWYNEIITRILWLIPGRNFTVKFKSQQIEKQGECEKN